MVVGASKQKMAAPVRRSFWALLLAGAPCLAVWTPKACEESWRVEPSGMASFHWPDECNRRHFGGSADVFELLRGKHTLVIGNSVARHVAVALHAMLQRPAEARAIVALGVSERNLSDAESSIWAAHGGGSAEFDESSKVVGTSCQLNQRRIHFPKAVVSCCLANKRASKKTALLTYAYTGTPSEPQLHKVLRSWAGKKNCADSLVPEFVVLALTTYQPPFDRSIFHLLKSLQSAHPLLGASTHFFILTVPHRAGANEAKLADHERDARKIGRGIPGVHVVPATSGTTRGVKARALVHQDMTNHSNSNNKQNFNDLGRYYLVDLLLSAFERALGKKDNEADPALRQQGD